jgi:hypothetical protein
VRAQVKDPLIEMNYSKESKTMGPTILDAMIGRNHLPDRAGTETKKSVIAGRKGRAHSLLNFFFSTL